MGVSIEEERARCRWMRIPQDGEFGVMICPLSVCLLAPCKYYHMTSHQARAHTHTHTHTHMRAHARTHERVHTQWLRTSTSAPNSSPRASISSRSRCRATSHCFTRPRYLAEHHNVPWQECKGRRVPARVSTEDNKSTYHVKPPLPFLQSQNSLDTNWPR